jgi:hypothetical protein
MDSYKFGNKNNWRRRQWNLIRDRISVSPKDAVVLYLAGPEDLDREVAISKGFRDSNLIAVERNKRTAAGLRKKGILTLNCDIIDAIYSYNRDKKIDVLVADLTCGLEHKIWFAVAMSWLLPQMSKAVYSLNMQRGRENRFAAVDAMRKISKQEGSHELFGMHRALMLYRAYLETYIYSGFQSFEIDDSGMHFYDIDNLLYLEAFYYTKLITNPSEPISYKSDKGNLVFDSIVFKSVGDDILKNFINGQHAQQFVQGIAFNKKNVRRSLGAILAHRTRRLAA